MDLRRWLLAAATLALLVPIPAFAQNTAPVVSNVQAQQIADSGIVEVTYDVYDAEGDDVFINLVFSSDNGATFAIYPDSVVGDLREIMPAGPGKRIEWHAYRDIPGRYFPEVVAKVVATDATALLGEMVFVPAGPFVRGTDAGGTSADFYPPRTLTLSDYWIDIYEVSCAQYQFFMEQGGYDTQAWWSEEGWAWKTTYAVTAPENWGDDALRLGPSWPGFPVHGVSWYEAEAYARFAGKRLPTEAEWEKAARVADFRYPWGSDVIDGSYANYGSSGDPYEPGTTPVGFYDGHTHPNPLFETTDAIGPYGAYDQAGNVIEWVQDWYDAEYYQESSLVDPLGPANEVVDGGKVRRGGANTYVASSCNVWRRFHEDEGLREPNVGFRCAKSP